MRLSQEPCSLLDGHTGGQQSVGGRGRGCLLESPQFYNSASGCTSAPAASSPTTGDSPFPGTPCRRASQPGLGRVGTLGSAAGLTPHADARSGLDLVSEAGGSSWRVSVGGAMMMVPLPPTGLELAVPLGVLPESFEPRFPVWPPTTCIREPGAFRGRFLAPSRPTELGSEQRTWQGTCLLTGSQGRLPAWGQDLVQPLPGVCSDAASAGPAAISAGWRRFTPFCTIGSAHTGR